MDNDFALALERQAQHARNAYALEQERLLRSVDVERDVAPIVAELTKGKSRSAIRRLRRRIAKHKTPRFSRRNVGQISTEDDRVSRRFGQVSRLHDAFYHGREVVANPTAAAIVKMRQTGARIR